MLRKFLCLFALHDWTWNLADLGPVKARIHCRKCGKVRFV